MQPHEIERINELARKKKMDGLTQEETAEHTQLRQKYISLMRKNLEHSLNSIVIEHPDGSRQPLKKKK